MDVASRADQPASVPLGWVPRAVQMAWDPVLPLHPGCVTSGRLLTVSVLHCAWLQNEGSSVKTR